jgi:hypothetical protein
MMAQQVSQETQKALDDFTAADAAFSERWSLFEQEHAREMEELDRLREARNAALDTATRAVRTEADLNSKSKSFSVSGFTAQKKESKFFNPDMFIARLHERDLYDKAKTAGAIVESVEVKYAEAKAFLDREHVASDFEDCEDAKDLTTAISGPKPVGAFGSQMKKK